MLQSLFGYDAYTAGLIMSPGGIAVMVFMPVSGYLLSRGVDARYLICFGLLSVAAASYWTAFLTLDASPEVLVIRRSRTVRHGFRVRARQYSRLYLFAEGADEQCDGPVQLDSQ